MKDNLKEKVFDILDEKLSSNETEELVRFLRQSLDNKTGLYDDHFFKNLAYEMKGQMKDLAKLIIDFRRELKTKIHPEITAIATKYIPQATDQLEAIIETTEMATHKIMDNLEGMQGNMNAMKKTFSSLNEGTMIVPSEKEEKVEIKIDSQTIKTISPLIDYVNSNIKNYMSLISDSFIQMSFQDLTGQRIKRIIILVSQMEEKLKDMVISFGIKLTEKEKNPNITSEELQRAVDEKVTELVGPQREGQGLDQAGIDELLSNL